MSREGDDARLYSCFKKYEEIVKQVYLYSSMHILILTYCACLLNILQLIPSLNPKKVFDFISLIPLTRPND